MLRLLLRASCFEVMLNRRMPNGMYGGVRGGLNSPYSIAQARAEESVAKGGGQGQALPLSDDTAPSKGKLTHDNR